MPQPWENDPVVQSSEAPWEADPVAGGEENSASPDSDFRLPEEAPIQDRATPGDIQDMADAGDPYEEASWGEVLAKSGANIPTSFKQAYGGAKQYVAERGPTQTSPIVNQIRPMLLDFVKDVAPTEDDSVTDDALFGWADEKIARRGKEIVEKAQEEMRRNQPDVEYGSPKYYVGKAVESSGYTIPALVGSLVSRSPSVGASMMAPLVKGQSYGQARSEGMGETQADIKSTFEAITESASETIPLGWVTGTGKSVISRTLGGAVAEGTQEMLNEAANIGYEVGVLDEEMSQEEVWRTLRDSGIIGAIMGGGMGVMGEAGVQARKRLGGETESGEGTPEAPAPEDLAEPSDEAVAESGEPVDIPGMPAEDAGPWQNDPIVDQEAGAGDTQAEESVTGETQTPPNLQDRRLRRPEYRNRLQTLTAEMQEGGGGAGALVRDETGAVVDRAKSQNPEWAQELLADTGMSVRGVKAATDKALAGKRLGDRQRQAVEGLLDTVEAERGEVAEAKRRDRDEARRARRTARPVSEEEIAQGRPEYREEDVDAGIQFAEPEYEGMTGEERTVQELFWEAKDAGAPQEELDASIETNDDAVAARRLFELREEYRGASQGEDQGRLEEGAAPRTPEVEQRRDIATRKQVEQMEGWEKDLAIAELRNERITSPITGLPNKVAFDEDADAGANIVAADLDGLGWYNDNLGHEAADEILREVGRAAQEVEGARFYHRSGDEFAARAPTPEAAEQAVQDLQDRLAERTVEVSYTVNGEPRTETIQGIGISYGTGASYDAADAAANEQKAERERLGLRAPKGETPPGVARADRGEGRPRQREDPDQVTEAPAQAGASSLEAAQREAATAPDNTLPEPTEAQKAAGNYKVGKARLHGLDISIENPAGSTRSGTAPDGTRWSNTMTHPYGYIRGTEGKDGDAVDAYFGPEAEVEAPRVHVIDQVNQDRSFDEHKAMFGFPSRDAAIEAYLSNYEPGWEGLGGVREMSLEDFKDWLGSGKRDQRAAKPISRSQAKRMSQEMGPSKPTESREEAEGTTALPKGEGSMTADAVSKAIANVRLNWGTNAPDVEVVQSLDQLPAQVQAAAEEGNPVQGVTYRGDVYLVADNLSSPALAKRVLAHEAVGHASMETMLGDAFPDVLSRVQRLQEAGNKRVTQVAEEVRQRYGQLDPDTEAKEVLAVMAEKGVKHPVLKEAGAALKRWLRKLGFNMPWSQTELEALIAKAGRYIRQDGARQPKGQAAKGPTFSQEGQEAPRPANAPQGVDTDSEAFKRWFGDSKVVDENGEPLVVYHGTAQDFEAFDPSRAGDEKYSDWGAGIYLTPDPSTADYYREDAAKNASGDADAIFERMEEIERNVEVVNGAPQYPDEYFDLLRQFRAVREQAGGEAGTVMPLYASIQNPMIVEYQPTPDPTVAEKAKEQGHDGVIVRKPNGGIDEVVAFEPVQIKSVNNRGTFDPNDPRITFSRDTTNPEAVEAGQPGSAFKRIARAGFDPVKGWWKKYWTSAGHIPEETFDRKIQEDGWVRSHEKVGEELVKDLRRAARKGFGGNPTQEQTRLMDAALKSQVPLSQLPEAVRLPVKQMRQHIDQLSQKMVREGVVSGDLAAKVTDNLGIYATRSYRVFDDPDWAKNVPAEVRNKAKNFIRDQYTDTLAQEWANKHEMSVEQAKTDMATPGTEANRYREGHVEGKIEELLFDGKAADSPMAMISSGSKLGSKDLSILKKRKDIAPEIRALWGEYREPMINYVHSVEKMAHLISNHRLLRDMRDQGMGRWFHDKPVVRDGIAYNTKVATQESDVLWPMTQWGEERVDIYTTPEIKEALEEAVAGNQVPAWLSHYMKANSIVKASKTIGSVMTHVRNLVGNPGFAIAQGHWQVHQMGRAWKTTMGDLAKMNDTELRNYIAKMLQLGVIHESVRAGEMRDVIEEAARSTMDEFTGNRLQRAAKKSINKLTEVYQAEDDLWKYYAFENEKARFQQAYPDKAETEIEEMAAKVVRNTYPTYSLVSRGVKAIRRFPVAGTFVSFPAEVIRVTGNTVQLISEEVRSDNPQVRRIGAQRLVGSLTAASLPTMASIASMYMMGISGEDDEDFRQFVPPWSRNSDIIYVGHNDKGQLKWIDLSYTDPFEYVKTPIRAFLNGDDWQQAVIDSFWQAAEPFAGEEILFGKITDIARNKTETGGQVYNPQASYNEIAISAAQHLWDAFEPGTLSSAERIYKGMTGEVEDYGKSYDATREALAMITGFRNNTMDIPQALSFKASDYAKGKRDAARMLTYKVASRGDVTDAELKEAFERSRQTHKRIFKDLHEAVNAAVALGMTREEVLKLLSANGVSKADAMNLVRGRFVPYRPSSRFFQDAMEGAMSEQTSAAKRRRMQQAYQERAEQLKRLYEQEGQPEVLE